jgi:hypothetical protein
MSQCDPTDLLCSSRREELTLDEQRRLRESLQYSLEVRLMSGILAELERESRVRPGDDVLLARINARALAGLGSPLAPIETHVATKARAPLRARAKRRTVMLLVAAAVLLVAGLAGAWLGGVRPRRTPPPAPPRATVTSAEKPVPKPRFSGSTARIEPADSSEASEPNQAVAPAPPPKAHEPAPSASGASEPSSASALFVRANSLRRQGRSAEAAMSYQLLLDLYPNSREVGPTRLALAKHLQTSQPERALEQFRALASSGGALRAEGLWGISEVAAALNRRSASEEALAELQRDFPDSPYAEVARARAAP